MDDLISRQVLELWNRYKLTIAVDAIEYDRELKQLLSTNSAEVGTDCISRQAAIDAVRNIIPDNRSIGICEELEQLPPIQPKRGRWEEKDFRYHCSCCDGIAPKAIRWDFCPHCGVKMEK